MRQIQPPVCAVERVYGVKSAERSQGTAQARSQGSQWLQSSQGTCSFWPSSSERKPLQSTKKSPSMRWPDLSVSDWISPEAPSSATSTTCPSTRVTPRAVAQRRRKSAYSVASK